VAAVAVLAAHAVVDALVLAPGAELGDHVAALVVPLAVLGLAVWGYSRLLPGWRAVLALSLSLLALVGAAVSISAARVEPIDLSVLTGMALAPAGLTLGALGIWLLWRSRRSDGHPIIRRTLLGLGAVFFAFEVLVPVGFAIVATNRPAEPPAAANLGRPYESVEIETTDGLELGAWWVPPENGAAVITYPDRQWTPDQSRMLAENGFGVLALDMRGYGASEGAPNSYGWGATADIDAAVEFLQDQPGVEPGRIGALGLSVGGEVLLEAAAENSDLRAVVADGAGERSVRETLLYGPAAVLVLPQMAIQTAAVSILSGQPPPPSLGDVVESITPGATFLIEAENGAGGEDLNPEYFERAGDPKQIWEVPGAGHTDGLDARPAEYERRVVAFFNQYLKRRNHE
jgi:fermentation-respiration switch protein FrsA (DUF1100 family)